jgi:hypothetical protein
VGELFIKQEKVSNHKILAELINMILMNPKDPSAYFKDLKVKS